MPYLSLYRKYRSQSFEDLAGQEHVTRTLQNAIRGGRVAHAYLFSGPRGTGKTIAARLLARALNCERGPTPTPCGECVSCREIRDGISPSVVEIDAASSRGIDEVRELRQRAMTVPSQAGARKVFIVDEVHMLTTEACNALLKTLEEPPAHVLFVLATTDAQKLPATILSRCQRFEFRRGSVALISERIRYVAESEGFAIEPEAVRRVARASGGSWRDAISLLEQVLSYGESAVTAATVAAILGAVEEEALLELAEGLARAEGHAVYALVERLISEGTEPRQLARDLGEHFRALLMADAGALPEDAYRPEMARLMAEQAGRFGTRRLVAALEALAQAEKEMRWSDSGRVVLEVALARLMLLTSGDSRQATGDSVGEGRRQGRLTTGQFIDARGRLIPAHEPSRGTPGWQREGELGATEQPQDATNGSFEGSSPLVPEASEAPPPAPAEFDPFEHEELPETVLEQSKRQVAAGPVAEWPDASAPDLSDPAPGVPPLLAPTPAPTSWVPAQHLAPTLGLAQIQDRWNVVIEELKRKRSPQGAALLADAQPVRCDGKTMVIGFRYDTHRDLWERGDHKKRLAAALEAVLGQPLQVRSEVIGEGTPAQKAAGPEPRQPSPSDPGEPRPPVTTSSGASDTLQGEALLHEVIAFFDGQVVENPES